MAAHAGLNTLLRPGDLLIAGAVPAGSELRPGDVCQVEADEIGVLRNRVR